MVAADGRRAHRDLLGQTVRDLRERRGMSVRQMALELGVSIGTVSAIENGTVSTSSERVIHLADLLDTRPDLLLSGTAEPVVDDRWESVAITAADPNWWRAYEPLELDRALAGALESFLELGYHGSTMRGIAAAAGLSVAGVYHHYASKQQMLGAILDRTMCELEARTSAARETGEDPRERFVNLVECHVLFHTIRRELGFIGASEMRSLAPATHARIVERRRREQAKVDGEVAQGRSAGVFTTTQPRAAARAVVTMCTAVSHWYRPTGELTPDRVAGQYVDFALGLVGSTR